MATTQYIGARYVPLFADPAEWSSTKQYEPLTIVLHQGNSFTSKQFVPIGVDINDTNYWAETGNYNAQVEQYRQEVLRFNDAVSTYIDKKIYVSMLGIEEGDDISHLLQAHTPIILDCNCGISVNDLSIDDVDFNGFYIENISNINAFNVNLSKSKSGIRLKETCLSVIADNINIDDVMVERLRKSGFMVLLKGVDNVTINNFNLHGKYEEGVVTNTDGIHISHGGKNIVISNGVIDAGDDAISICGDDGNPIDTTLGGDIENVLVTNVVCKGDNYSGIRLLNQNHVVKNVYVCNSVFTSKIGPTFRATYINSSTKTGKYQNVSIVNCEMQNNVDSGSETQNTRIIMIEGIEGINIDGINAYRKYDNNLPFYIADSKDIEITNVRYGAEIVNPTPFGTHLCMQLFECTGYVKVDGFYYSRKNAQRSEAAIRIISLQGRTLDSCSINNVNVQSETDVSGLIVIRQLIHNLCVGLITCNNLPLDSLSLIELTTQPENYYRYAHSKTFTGVLTYDGAKFPFDLNKAVQIVIQGRNNQNGDIITAWYDNSAKGFRPVGTTVTEGATLNTTFTWEV